MASTLSTRACIVCGHGESLRCSGCKQVYYCSKKCQKSHWKTHKEKCRVRDLNDNYEKIDFNQIRSLIEKDLTDVTLSKSLYESAIAKTQKMFPGKQVISTLDAISPKPKYNVVFLGFISKFHPYFFRHAIYIQDINNKESFVTFYLDYDKPEPYFDWFDVRPGRFVVVIQPFLHHFMDGQVGFRIEEPHEVRFLDG